MVGSIYIGNSTNYKYEKESDPFPSLSPFNNLSLEILGAFLDPAETQSKKRKKKKRSYSDITSPARNREFLILFY